MPFNVLLLPLLGGYVLVASWNVTKFYCRREASQRLVFWSAIAGFCCLAVSYTRIFFVNDWFPSLAAGWKSFAGYPHLGKSIGALCIGVLAPHLLNIWSKQHTYARKAVEKWGDSLELLFRKSMDDSKLVSITLKGGKVYIGRVTSAHDPSFERRFVRLLPILSGFRRQEDRTLCVTTHYESAYKEFYDGSPPLFNESDFELVISVDEIQSASIFDAKVYEFFNPPPTKPSGQETPQNTSNTQQVIP